jgi:hypothetical protein
MSRLWWLFYFGLFFLLIPIHELGHLWVAYAQNLKIISVELIGLAPSVVVEGRGHILFNLVGMLVTVPLPASLAMMTKKGQGRTEFIVLALAAVSMGIFDLVNLFL